MLELYPFQDTGADWLVHHNRAALYDEQGLGKTITTIVAAARARCRKMLFVVPSIVAWNWWRELNEWWFHEKRADAPDANSCDVLYSRVLTSATSRVLQDVGAFITTHGLVFREPLRSKLLSVAWDLIVLDESHFFRTPTAKRTRAFFGKWRSAAPRLVDCAERVWLLSGTPTPNNCSELWPSLFGLWPERILNEKGEPMSPKGFRAKFCHTRPTPYGPKVTGNKNVEELKQVIAPTFLRRRTRDHWKDLPEIRFERIVLRPTALPWELETIEQDLDRALVEKLVEDSEDLSTIEAGFKRLASGVPFSHYRRLCGLAKVEPVAELIDMELQSGLEKLVVFGHHVAVLEGLRLRLHKYPSTTLTGSDSARARQDHIDRFQLDPSIRLIFCNIVAGGTGATLTAASEALFAEMSFVPGENAQAADRIHRIGQHRGTRARFVALGGTVDELLTETLRRKTRMIREVLQ